MIDLRNTRLRPGHVARTGRAASVPALALALFAVFAAAPASAQNPLFKPYKMPAEAGAAMQLHIGKGQVTGQLGADDLVVDRDDETGCIQNVGGVIIEEGSNVQGDIDIVAVATGPVINYCQ